MREITGCMRSCLRQSCEWEVCTHVSARAEAIGPNAILAESHRQPLCVLQHSGLHEPICEGPAAAAAAAQPRCEATLKHAGAETAIASYAHVGLCFPK
eukprot:COSAG05_NODE_1299_length_5244_cov_93.435180_4_plen_98_part_00